MTNLALRLPALLYALTSAPMACAWSETRPTLVLQLSRVERARRTAEESRYAREVVLSAAISMSLDQAEVESPTQLAASATAESALRDARDPPECTSPASDLCDATQSDATRGGANFDAAIGCESSPTLCAWAHSSEEAAVLAVLESAGAAM